MDWDDVKRLADERRRENFAGFQRHFNEAMKRNGSDKTLDDFMGMGGGTKPSPEAPASPMSVPDMVEYLLAETSDETAPEVMVRALAVYRSIVKHAREGGAVQFVGSGAPKTLKIRLRSK